jgi:hypothetical protein
VFLCMEILGKISEKDSRLSNSHLSLQQQRTPPQDLSLSIIRTHTFLSLDVI